MANSYAKNRYLAALDPAQSQAQQAQDFYLKRSTTFDPYAALDKAAQGATGRFRRDVGRSVQELRGQQVGMGRLDTGFATQDEDRVVTDLADREQENLNSQALQATGLDLRNIEGVGQYGLSQGNTYLDLLTGQLDRETADANAKRQMWASILGGLSGIAGAYAGAH